VSSLDNMLIRGFKGKDLYVVEHKETITADIIYSIIFALG